MDLAPPEVELVALGREDLATLEVDLAALVDLAAVGISGRGSGSSGSESRWPGDLGGRICLHFIPAAGRDLLLITPNEPNVAGMRPNLFLLLYSEL